MFRCASTAAAKYQNEPLPNLHARRSRSPGAQEQIDAKMPSQAAAAEPDDGPTLPTLPPGNNPRPGAATRAARRGQSIRSACFPAPVRHRRMIQGHKVAFRSDRTPSPS
jgi:hypothetical protein